MSDSLNECAQCGEKKTSVKSYSPLPLTYLSANLFCSNQCCYEYGTYKRVFEQFKCHKTMPETIRKKSLADSGVSKINHACAYCGNKDEMKLCHLPGNFNNHSDFEVEKNILFFCTNNECHDAFWGYINSLYYKPPKIPACYRSANPKEHKKTQLAITSYRIKKVQGMMDGSVSMWRSVFKNHLETLKRYKVASSKLCELICSCPAESSCSSNVRRVVNTFHEYEMEKKYDMLSSAIKSGQEVDYNVNALIGVDEVDRMSSASYSSSTMLVNRMLNSM